MKRGLMVSTIFLTGLLLLAVFGGGCGSTSTNYFYYYPDWTPDGRIICSKNVQTVSQGSGTIGGSGGYATNYYTLAIMDADGTNERDIKNIGNSAKVAASPLGNYYAYVESFTNIIHVVATSGASVADIDGGATIDSLDWGPDESKLVYGIKNSSTSEIYTVNRDGTAKTFLTIGEAVAWRIGDYVAFEYSSPEGVVLSTIKNDGTSVNRLRIGFDAQIISSEAILYSYGLQVRQINFNVTNDILLFDGFDRSFPKLSYDKKKIAAMNSSKGYGIYVIDISGTGEVQIK